MNSPKMNSILQIDGIGKRYGVLPSQVIREADTFDLYIMDAAMYMPKTWITHIDK